MLPQALKCAERPAVALLAEREESLRGLGQGNRFDIVSHSPAEPLDRNGQVLIFGQGIFGIAAHRIERLTSPGPDRAGDHGDRSQRIERTAFHVLRRHIFDRLPAGDQVDLVADPRVAGHCADQRVFEPAHQLGYRVLKELGIGIERDDNFAARLP